MEREIRAGVTNRSGDFEPVAYDAGIGEERGDFFSIVTGNFLRVEMVKGAAVIFAFGENRRPAEAGLCALENQEFEERAIVVQRHAPLGVVVGEIERIAGPRAGDGFHRWAIERRCRATLVRRGMQRQCRGTRRGNA